MKRVYKSLFPTFKFLGEPIEDISKIKGPLYLLFVSLWDNENLMEHLAYIDYLSETGPSWPEGLEESDLTTIHIVDSWNWPEYFGNDFWFKVTTTPTLVRVEDGEVSKITYPPLVYQVLFEGEENGQ